MNSSCLESERAGCHADIERHIFNEELPDAELICNGSIGRNAAGAVGSSVGEVSFPKTEEIGIDGLRVAEFHPAVGGTGVDKSGGGVAVVTSGNFDDGEFIFFHGNDGSMIGVEACVSAHANFVIGDGKNLITEMTSGFGVG